MEQEKASESTESQSPPQILTIYDTLSKQIESDQYVSEQLPSCLNEKPIIASVSTWKEAPEFPQLTVWFLTLINIFSHPSFSPYK